MHVGGRQQAEARVMVLLDHDPQKGAETIKEMPQRSAEGAKAVQEAGGRVIAAYATLGRYDYVYITEFPDSKVPGPSW
jgi:uncharacterized protein with GYD domain